MICKVCRYPEDEAHFASCPEVGKNMKSKIGEQVIKEELYTRRAIDELNAPQYKGVSGATSSEEKLPYSDVRFSLIRRLARRIELGNKNHGRGNYYRSFSPRVDRDYLRERYNHALEHLHRLTEGTATDDHIGAVAWFLMFACVAEEEFGVDWSDILKIRTPEEEAKIKGRR